MRPLWLALILAVFSMQALAREMVIVNPSGDQIRFSLSSMLYNTQNCSFSVYLNSTATCTGNCNAPIQPCTSLLNLDGRFYPIRGNMEFWPNLYFVDSTVSYCRQSDGSALPASPYATLVLGIWSIPLPGEGLKILTRSWGDELQITSLNGNIICDGEVPAPAGSNCPLPTDAIAADSFEECP